MNEDSLLQAVLNTIEDGICLLDREGRVRLANSTAAGILDSSTEALVGRSVFEVFAADQIAPSLKRLFDSGRSCREESASSARKDGQVVYVSYSLAPVREHTRIAAAMLRFRETSAPQACDIALRDSEAKLRAIVDTIADGVIAIDEQGIVQLFNPAAEQLFGHRCEEVMGRNVNMLMPSPDREAHDGYIANYLRTGVRKIIGIGREVTGKRKDGTTFPLHLAIGEAWVGKKRLFAAVIHDLTARKQTEAKLLTLSSAVEQSPAAVMIANAKGIIEYVNPSFTRLTGYTSEELVGESPSLLRSAGTSLDQYRRLQAALLKASEWREEIQDRKKSGEIYWALETIAPIRNPAGAVTHFLAIQQDITEQKRGKEALRASEERFRRVAEMAGEWLWEQDAQGRYVYSSAAVRQILGYEPEEILGKPYLDLLTDEDRKRWTADAPPGPDIQKPFHRLVNRYRHKDGHEVFTESSGEPVLDGQGRLVKWRGVDYDISSRKCYEDALRLRDRAIEAVSVGINIADARLKQNPNIYVNPALSRMTGYSREELLGQNMRLLQGPETDRNAVEAIGRALREGRSCNVILKNYRKDGTWFWNELFISPVRDEAGQLTHFIGVQSDVTERLHAEEAHHELEIAKQIQLSLLPKAPLQLDGARVAGVCLPATHIGGDYYDYFHVRDGLDMVIADVSGHSVGAALVMVEARSALKAETRRIASGPPGHGAADILCALNELLHEDLSGADLFITMFYLRYDPAARRLRYANAGHNCALLLRQGNGRCEELDAEGLVIGVRKDVEFEEKTVQLNRGDRVLLYTDGVTDTQNPAGEFFGSDRLRELFSAYRLESPETVVSKLVETLRDFAHGRPFIDDISMVVLKVD
jgi:sigma-B regulation protein RsbU (phosphoserine phosphatase)